MGGLLVAVVAFITVMMYSNKWIIDIDNVEKSNTAKKYLENAKSSQEQMMLKGDANLFSAYVSDELSIKDQNILNKIYYELKNDSNFNKNLLLDINVLCAYVNSQIDYISLVDCINVMGTDYNFIDMKSNGAEITVDSSYNEALEHINNLHQNGYDVSLNKAVLSNNTLYKFDANLKEIQYMSSGEKNYVSSDIINYENSTTLEIDAIKLDELGSIINTSLTNKNSLLSNIIDSSITTKYATMKELIQNVDVDGNIISLTNTFSDETFNDISKSTNLEVVNSFKMNKTDTYKSFNLTK